MSPPNRRRAYGHTCNEVFVFERDMDRETKQRVPEFERDNHTHTYRERKRVANENTRRTTKQREAIR
jgi:hypothetical protein